MEMFTLHVYSLKYMEIQ